MVHFSYSCAASGRSDTSVASGIALAAFGLTGIGLAGGRTRFTLTEGRGDATGLELRGEGELDLDLLRLLAPGIERSDGLATVELTTTGRTGAVQTAVDIDIAAELFRHESFPAALEDITGTRLHAAVVAGRTADFFRGMAVSAAVSAGIVPPLFRVLRTAMKSTG